MKAMSGKKYTAKELAAQFGCTDKTVRNHANKLFGQSQNGVERKFDEAQVTLLLESIKEPVSSGAKSNLENDLLGAETEMTLDLQIALAERKSRELWKRKASENEARAVKAEAALGRLSMEHHDALAANTQLFDIAVSAGALTSDREDMLSTYRRTVRTQR